MAFQNARRVISGLGCAIRSTTGPDSITSSVPVESISGIPEIAIARARTHEYTAATIE